MDLYEYEKYITNIEGLSETIKTYGVAIIPNVINDNECEEMVSGIWDYFEKITGGWKIPLSRNNSKTWKGIYDLFPMHNMMMQHFQVGHAEVSWKLRQNEKIVDIFAKFYDVKQEELLVSFDGLSFHLPPEKTKKDPSDKTWYHTDQSYQRNDFECVQSWITGLDVNQGDATLGFLEGSNNYHKKFSDDHAITHYSDWYKLSELEEKYYRDLGCTPKRITCPKGSMVFWDSRTIHYGAESISGRKRENLRAVVYLCYMPRLMCSQINLEKKRKAYNELRTTNHYPCNPKLFPLKPRTYGKKIEVTNIEQPQLNALGLKLAGFKKKIKFIYRTIY